MSFKPLEPVFVVGLFPELREHLLSLLADLSAEEWRASTACPGWSVKDIALHLLGVDISNLSWRRDGVADSLDPFIPAGGSLMHSPTLAATINRSNEAWVQGARRISGRLLRE